MHEKNSSGIIKASAQLSNLDGDTPVVAVPISTKVGGEIQVEIHSEGDLQLELIFIKLGHSSISLYPPIAAIELHVLYFSEIWSDSLFPPSCSG